MKVEKSSLIVVLKVNLSLPARVRERRDLYRRLLLENSILETLILRRFER
jgi:hypothetical protein